MTTVRRECHTTAGYSGAARQLWQRRSLRRPLYPSTGAKAAMLQLHPSIFLPFGPTAAERGKPTDAFRCRLPRQPVVKVWAGGSPQFEMRDDERTELNRATVVSLASVEAAGGAGAIARINLLLAMGGRCVCTLTPPACFLPHTRALHASPAEARCLPHTRSLSANPAELC